MASVRRPPVGHVESHREDSRNQALRIGGLLASRGAQLGDGGGCLRPTTRPSSEPVGDWANDIADTSKYGNLAHAPLPRYGKHTPAQPVVDPAERTATIPRDS